MKDCKRPGVEGFCCRLLENDCLKLLNLESYVEQGKSHKLSRLLPQVEAEIGCSKREECIVFIKGHTPDSAEYD
jgi:hypothetical protein